ncbi:MAG: sigma-70 family RNA polymerase sigma factor [Balneolaceae bacterium]|nr:sigma-70 family RNA polymerase sigma factor [Balneolaceae bacterium]
MGSSQQEPTVQRARTGDQSAFRELYERHVDALFRFLMQFSANRAEVKDWVQQAFIKAFENLNTFEGRSQFRTWLWRIAINEMKMSRRGALRFDTMEELPDNGKAQGGLPPETLMTMRSEIENLDERKRMVLILYEVEGYSHREIAGMLEVGESTSRTILTRAKSELREQIGKRP